MNRMMFSVVAAGCALAGFAEGFVVAKDGAAVCAVVAGAAIDAPQSFLLSFQLFEDICRGEAELAKQVARAVQVNVVHVSS